MTEHTAESNHVQRQRIADELPSEVLDLSYQPLASLTAAGDIPATVKEIDLTNCKLTKIEAIEHCTRLERLILRQNLVAAVENLGTLSALSHLDLYLNALTTIERDAFRGNPRLRFLDLSFNEIRELGCLQPEQLPELRELYLIANKIRELSENVGRLGKLEVLELGDNRLRNIEFVGNLVTLRSLWLGKNKITEIENINTLVNLRVLSLQSNRLTRISGLSGLTSLEELYLGSNGIESLDGLENLPALKTLDVSVNRVRKITCIDALVGLEELWLNNNLIENIEDISILRPLTALTTLYFEGNPCSRAMRDAGEGERYRGLVAEALPGLETLDATPM